MPSMNKPNAIVQERRRVQHPPDVWPAVAVSLSQSWRRATDPVASELQALLQSLEGISVGERSQELESLIASLNQQSRRLQAVFRDTVTGDRGRLILSVAGERPTLRLFAGHQKFRRHRAFPSLTVEREADDLTL
jgi:hypothetical protein